MISPPMWLACCASIAVTLQARLVNQLQVLDVFVPKGACVVCMLVLTAERGWIFPHTWLAARRWYSQYTVTCCLFMRSRRKRFLRFCQRRCALGAQMPPPPPNTSWGKNMLLCLCNDALRKA